MAYATIDISKPEKLEKIFRHCAIEALNSDGEFWSAFTTVFIQSAMAGFAQDVDSTAADVTITPARYY